MTTLPAENATKGSASARPPRRWLIPSVEVIVLVIAGGLVLATALAVSANATSHLQDAATKEAITAVSAVVHGYVDPLLSMDLLGAPDTTTTASSSFPAAPRRLQADVSSASALRAAASKLHLGV